MFNIPSFTLGALWRLLFFLYEFLKNVFKSFFADFLFVLFFIFCSFESRQSVRGRKCFGR